MRTTGIGRATVGREAAPAANDVVGGAEESVGDPAEPGIGGEAGVSGSTAAARGEGDGKRGEDRPEKRRNLRGGLGVPQSLAEYRSHVEGGTPAWAEGLAEGLAQDPGAFRAALSPGRLPAGRIPDAADGRGPGAEEGGGEVGTPGAVPDALARAEANGVLLRLKRGRGALTPGVLEAASGFDLARDLLADSVVERARALAGFDDPADAFSRSGRRAPGSGGEEIFAPWEVTPKLAGGGTQGAPFLFVARDSATLWRAALALAGAGVDGREVSAEEGLVAGAAHPEAVCVGIGGPKNPDAAEKGPEARLGAAALPHLLASVIHGLEAPFRARQRAQAAEGSPDANRASLLAQSAAGARPAERFPGQRRWDLARKDFSAAEDRLRSAIGGVRLLEEALLARPGLVRAAARATDEEARAREEKRRRKALEERARRASGRADEELYLADSELEARRGSRPGFASRLLIPSRERRWLADVRGLEARYEASLARAEGAAAGLEEAEKAHEEARSRLSDAARAERSARKQLEKAQGRIERGTAELGPAAPDEALYAEDEEERRRALERAWVDPASAEAPRPGALAAPFVSEEVRGAAEEVLARALSLHRVFALVAARPVAENLRALFALAKDPNRGIAGAAGGDEEAPGESAKGRSSSAGPGPSPNPGKGGARDLLASLSLAAPASGFVLTSGISSALLGSLKREAAGWLVVFGEPEEAGSGDGEAAGAAALEDALFRARRAAFLDPS